MREKISQEVPMSHSFYGMPSHTTYSSLRIARLNQKLSAQQPHLPVESVSASDSLMDSISCQQFPLNLLGLTGRPENHCSPSTPNRLSDPFAWDLDMEHVPVDPGLVNHHNQAATENTAYSPSRITIPRYEYGDWSDINQLFPDKDKLEQSATYTDFQAAHTPHELNSPASFPDSEAFLSQYDLQTSPEPRPTFESPTSRPGSAVYSSFTPNYSLASSPMGETHPSVQPRSVPDGGVRLSEEDSDTDSATSDEPYARLIWRALMSARDHKMVLKEIYEWFEKNTNKAKNPDSKGWQNSIRHNLSMNAVSRWSDPNRAVFCRLIDQKGI